MKWIELYFNNLSKRRKLFVAIWTLRKCTGEPSACNAHVITGFRQASVTGETNLRLYLEFMNEAPRIVVPASMRSPCRAD